jgi:PhoH-like ATPase
MENSNSFLVKEDQRRIYVLDTNVLLHDPAAIFRFEEHIVLIPMIALEEVDTKKRDPVLGFNAREISQKLENLIRKGYNADEGLQLRNGRDGLLFKPSLSGPFPELELSYKDNVMLRSRICRRFLPGVHLRHQDCNLRNRVLGVKAEDQVNKISEEYLNSLFLPARELTLTTTRSTKSSEQGSESWSLAYQKNWRLQHNEGWC